MFDATQCVLRTVSTTTTNGGVCTARLVRCVQRDWSLHRKGMPSGDGILLILQVLQCMFGIRLLCGPVGEGLVQNLKTSDVEVLPTFPPLLFFFTHPGQGRCPERERSSGRLESLCLGNGAPRARSFETGGRHFWNPGFMERFSGWARWLGDSK